MIKRAAYFGLILSAVNLMAEPVYAAAVSAEQVAAAEKEALARQMEHKKLQAEAIQLSLELAEMNKKIISAAEKLQSDEEKTTRMEQDLALLEKKLQVTEEEFNHKYSNLSQTLASLQNLALRPTEALLVQPLTPVEIVRSAILLRESVPLLNSEAAKIKQDLDVIAQQKKEVETKLSDLAKQKESLLSQQKKIKKLSEQKSAIRKKVEGESLIAHQQAQKMAAEASDLRELMQKLEHDKEIRRRRDKEIRRAAREREEAARRRLEEEQKKRMAAGQSSGLLSEDGTRYQESPEGESMDLINLQPQRIQNNSTDFAKARGKLAQPARGTVITSYGQELSKGVTAKGIVIQTRGAAQVIAPYDGSVIFSGPFKGYGNLIIIEHGQGYLSLLAGMRSLDVETGQMVLAGEPVGQMPDSDSAKLYMEIRKGQLPVNPAPWLGI